MSSTGPSRPPWLDLLPVDVCERVVLHVSDGGHPTESALSLARTSPKLCAAVRGTIAPKFELPYPFYFAGPTGSQGSISHQSASWAVKWLTDSDYASAWLALIKEFVVEIAIRTKYSKRLEIVEHLLKSPTLQRVHLFDKRTLFAAIGQSRSIRELHLFLRSRKYGPNLFEALSRLNLEKLSTECKACDSPRSCPFRDTSQFNSGYNALAVSCPNLKSLKMWCTLDAESGERDGSTAPVWRIFPELPTLQELTFNGEAPEQAIPKLRKLQGVGISWATGAYQTAMRVGTPMMEFVTETALDAEQIRGLTRCPRLKKIAFEVKNGADVVLADTFRKLPSLADISLQWENRDECEHGDLENHNCYVDAVPGAMLSAVQAAPNLSVVSLLFVRVPLEELQNILSSAAERLTEFMTCIGDQDEAPCERLEELLYTAVKNNPGVRSFQFCDMVPYRLESDADVDRQHPRLVAAVERLHRHAPLLDRMQLENSIMKSIL